MKSKNFARMAAVCAGAVVLVVAGSSVAVAEPLPKAFRSYAAVGSDTTQDVWNGLSNGTGAPAPKVASYNAFGVAGTTIKTKSTGATFARPQGSGAGVRALSASKRSPYLYDNGAGGTVSIRGNIDFARSSSGPSSAFPGTSLRYIPFARDAVSVASRSLNSSITGFTTAQLTAIYTCGNSADGVITTAAGADPVYRLAAGGTQRLDPLIPQASSGTRSFFLSAIGITGSVTLGSCVNDGGFPENDGSALTTAGKLIPFSAATWIAQKNGAVTNTVSSTVIKLGRINGSAPTAGSGTALRPGPLFGSASTVPATGLGVFNRDTYNVVGASSVGTGVAAGLEKVLTTDLKTTAAKTIISKFGFLNLTYLGDRTLYKSSGYTS